MTDKPEVVKMTDKPEVVKMSVEMVQEGNTLGTTDDTEILFVDFEYQMPGEEPFMVIKSEGWSFDEPEALLEMLKKLQEAEVHIREGMI